MFVNVTAGRFEVFCDGCTHDEEVEVYTTKQVRDSLLDLGWDCRLIDDDWYHHCPECVKNGRHLAA